MIISWYNEWIHERNLLSSTKIKGKKKTISSWSHQSVPNLNIARNSLTRSPCVAVLEITQQLSWVGSVLPWYVRSLLANPPKNPRLFVRLGFALLNREFKLIKQRVGACTYTHHMSFTRLHCIPGENNSFATRTREFLFLVFPATFIQTSSDI